MDRDQQLRILEEIYGKVEEGKAVLISYSTSSDLDGKTMYTMSVIDATTGVSYTASSFTGNYYKNVRTSNQVQPLPSSEHILDKEYKKYMNNKKTNIFNDVEKDNNDG